jgi:hypothetical protein
MPGREGNYHGRAHTGEIKEKVGERVKRLVSVKQYKPPPPPLLLMDPNAIMRACGEEFMCHSKGCTDTYTSYQIGYTPRNHVHTGYCDKHSSNTRTRTPPPEEPQRENK